MGKATHREAILLFALSLFHVNNAYVLTSSNVRRAINIPIKPATFRGDWRRPNCHWKIRNRMGDRRTDTLLRASSQPIPLFLTGPSTRALACLVTSAMVGTWVDRLVPNGGILATVFASALFSGFQLAPHSHLLYDLCWNTFLPASLALLLLAMKEPLTHGSATAKTEANDRDSVLSVIWRMGLPFCMASVGSLAGCLLAFLVCCWKPLWLLVPRQAAVAASCLAASFVGGTVNFFATAAAISHTTAEPQEALNTLASSMAAADLVVMAIYFALISTALQSKSLRLWFDGEKEHNHDPVSSAEGFLSTSSLGTPNTTRIATHSVASRVQAPLAVSIVALILVHLARTVESVVERLVPGTACGFLAAVTPLLTRVMPPHWAFWNQMQDAAGPLSAFSFLLLFAAVGVSADLEATLYSGPACLVFSGIALTVHGVMALMGSWCLKHFAKRTVLLDDVLITSNAAIGGPATAAAFCARLRDSSRAVTVAATVWGVVGYAVGTTIGISLYRLLQSFLL